MEILLATHNPAKFLRYQRLLKDVANLNLLTLSNVNISIKVDEPYDNAKENAVYKAKEYAKMSGLPTIAIDEATSTNFLPDNEQPGVFVRRFANKEKEMTDNESLEVWHELFQKYPQNPKRFIWDFSIAYFNPQSDKLHYSKVVMESKVAEKFSDRIEKGYPMSSFLIIDGSSKP
jgi:inosine/xanthosine triphosphate pyrophosphatase family protein